MTRDGPVIFALDDDLCAVLDLVQHGPHDKPKIAHTLLRPSPRHSRVRNTVINTTSHKVSQDQTVNRLRIDIIEAPQ